MGTVSLEDVTQSLRACFKVLSKIQMPVTYMDVETEAYLEATELQSTEDKSKKTQVRHFTIFAILFNFLSYIF